MLEGFADGRIFGERSGSGATRVIALHGWQRSHNDFAPLAALGDRAMLAIDLPGFGASPPPPEPWGSREYAESLVPVIEGVGGPVTVLGHSLGGRIALQLASIAPGRVRALCLSGVPQLGTTASRRPSRAYRAVRFARRLGLVSETRLQRAREQHGSRDYRAAEGVMRLTLVRMLGERYATLLPTLDLPVELVWGELDTAAPVASARFAADALPHAHLEVILGAGHMLPVEQPRAIDEALTRLGA